MQSFENLLNFIMAADPQLVCATHETHINHAVQYQVFIMCIIGIMCFNMCIFGIIGIM